MLVSSPIQLLLQHSLLSSPVPALKRQAAIALGNLSVNDLNEVLIVQHNALQVFFSLLLSSQTSRCLIFVQPLLDILREDPGVIFVLITYLSEPLTAPSS